MSGMGEVTSRIIRTMGPDYARAEVQQFTTRVEANKFIEDYCNKCVNCGACFSALKLLEDLMPAEPGKECKYWADCFVRMTLKDVSASASGHPRNLVVCKSFQPRTV